MVSRLAKIVAATFLTCVICSSPAYAQKKKNEAPPKPAERKPVVEYILIVVLMAIPIGLVCRSSRRQT